MGAIAISDMGNNRFLFCFFHVVDMDQIEDEGPWNFNSHLLILHHLQEGEDLMTIPLSLSPFWILVHDIPHGCVSECVAQTLGDFIGNFIEYRTSAILMGYKGIMRLRVQVDIQKPLKR
ncbi:hypothetical protein V6N13_125230 [Hibiscus sabdariffa]